jgi:hypothetical protein
VDLMAFKCRTLKVNMCETTATKTPNTRETLVTKFETPNICGTLVIKSKIPIICATTVTKSKTL